jgi:hypothetical protein
MALTPPSALIHTPEWKSLDSDQQDEYVRKYVDDRKANDPTLKDYLDQDLYDAVHNQVTVQKVQDNAVAGPVVRSLGRARGAIQSSVSGVAQALGANEDTANMIGGVPAALLIDLPVGLAAGAATTAITKNPLAGAFAGDTMIGLVHALEETGTSGRLDVAGAQLATSMLAAPVGTAARGLSKLPAEASPALANSVLKSKLFYQNLGELVVNLPGNMYGINTEKEKGEALGSTIALQGVSTLIGYRGLRTEIAKNAREQMIAQALEKEHQNTALTLYRGIVGDNGQNGPQTPPSNELALRRDGAQPIFTQDLPQQPPGLPLRQRRLENNDNRVIDIAPRQETLQNRLQLENNQDNAGRINQATRDPAREQAIARQAEIMARQNDRASAPPSEFEIKTNEDFAQVRAIDESVHELSRKVVENQRAEIARVAETEAGVASALGEHIPATIPERPETIKSQLKLFSEGKKSAILLSDESVKTPKGASEVKIGDTRVIYDPAKHSEEQIRVAARQDRLGDILGYGTHNKPSDSDRAVVVRDRNGVEVQAVVSNRETQDSVLNASEKIKGDGDTVGVEHPNTVIKGRLDQEQVDALHHAIRTMPDFQERIRALTNNNDQIGMRVEARMAKEIAQKSKANPAWKPTPKFLEMAMRTHVKQETINFHKSYEARNVMQDEIRVPGVGEVRMSDLEPHATKFELPKDTVQADATKKGITDKIKELQSLMRQAKSRREKNAVRELMRDFIDKNASVLEHAEYLKFRKGEIPNVEKGVTMENSVIGTILDKFGIKVDRLTREQVAEKYPQIKDIETVHGFYDKASKRVVLLTDGKSEASILRTLRHEFGHIIYNAGDAAKILSSYSDADIVRLQKEFGTSRLTDLAEELFAEATSRVLERELERASAPMIKRVIYALSDFLEDMGINVMRATRDSGYVADLKITKDLRLLVNDLKEAALHVSKTDQYMADAMGLKDQFKFSRSTAHLDPMFQELFKDPPGLLDKAKNINFWTKLFVDRLADFKHIDEVQALIEATGVNIKLQDHINILQSFHGRSSGIADALLSDPNHGNLKEFDRILATHSTGDMRTMYGQWRTLKRYEYLITRSPRDVVLSNGQKIQVDTERVKPIKVNGVELDASKVNAQIASIENRVGTGVMQTFLDGSAREQKFYNKILDMQLQSGLINADTLIKLKDNPHYTPFKYLDGFEQKSKGGRVFEGPDVNQFVEEIHGMNNPLMNYKVLNNAVGYVHSISEAIEQNQVVRGLAALADAKNVLEGLKTPANKATFEAAQSAIDGIIKESHPTNMTPKGMEKRHVMVNGERKAFDIDHDIAMAMDNMLPQEMGILMKAMALPGVMVRVMAVSANWAFAARNLVRDVSTAMTMSPGGISGMAFLKELLPAMAEASRYVIANRIKLDFSPQTRASFANVVDLHKLGGLSGTQISESKGMAAQLLGGVGFKGHADTSINPGKLERAKAVFTAPSEISEIAVRTAIFNAIKKKTGDVRGAAFGARAIMDFERAGLITRELNKVIPFLNARTQGVSVMAQSVKNLFHPEPKYRAAAAMKLAFSGVIMQAGIGVLQAAYAGFSGKGDDALRASDNDWAKNFMFPLWETKGANGESAIQYVKIPKPEFYQTIFNPIEQGTRDSLKGQLSGASGLRAGAQILQSIVPINIVNSMDSPGSNAFATAMQVFGPGGTGIAQWLANKEFYTGRSIVPESQKNFNPEDQYRQSTLIAYRKMGSMLNMSPAQLETFAKTIGFTGMPMTLAKMVENRLPKDPRLMTPDNTSLSRELAQATGFAGIGGYQDTSALVNNEAMKSVDRAHQTQLADFKRKFYAAVQNANAGDTSYLKSLRSEVKKSGQTSWVQQIDESLKNSKLGQDRTMTMLRELSPQIRAASILEIESGLDGSAKYKFQRDLRKRDIMNDATATSYRRYKKFTDRGMSFEDLGKTLDKTYKQ